MESIKDKDSDGFDICNLSGQTFEEICKICQYMPYAECFNTCGWVKYHTTQFKDFTTNTLYILPRTSPTIPEEKQTCPTYCIHEPGRFDKMEYIKLFVENVIFDNTPKLTGIICILTDNAIFCDNWSDKLSCVLQQLKGVDWKMCFLGFPNSKPYDLWNDNIPKIKPFDEKLCQDKKHHAILINNDAPDLFGIFMTIPHLISSNSLVNESPLIINTKQLFFLENLKYSLQNYDIQNFQDWECFGPKGIPFSTPQTSDQYEQSLTSAVNVYGITSLLNPHTNNINPLTVQRAGEISQIVINNYEYILEVGGDYGSLASCILSSGYKGTYTIYNIDDMELIFRYYLRDKKYEFISSPKNILNPEKTLLISTSYSDLLTNVLKFQFADYFIITPSNMATSIEQQIGMSPKRYENETVIFY